MMVSAAKPEIDATSGVPPRFTRSHAVGLIRLAIVMLGDRAAAEDVVPGRVLWLYRNWNRVWIGTGSAAVCGPNRLPGVANRHNSG